MVAAQEAGGDYVWPSQRKDCLRMTSKENAPVWNGNVVQVGQGLVPDREWAEYFDHLPMDLVMRIRCELAARVVGLAEKVNINSHYFGYKVDVDDGDDALYLYVQQRFLRVDIRLSRNHTADFEAEGYEVTPHQNWQHDDGWTTGWHVPHDTGEPLRAVRWMLAALRHDAPVKLAKPPSPIT